MTFPPPQSPGAPGFQGNHPAYPAPSPAPQMAGPGGAYGPMDAMPGQPVPGQLPPPEMSMSKPGTITGIQVILWIFSALAAVGDVFSVINTIEYFSVIGLVALGYSAYSTFQALISPVYIGRGRRGFWIWNVINSSLGVALSVVVIVFGVMALEYGPPWTLIVGIVLLALHGTLLGLLCSRSARQWILMNRINRGEVQVAGMGGAPGTAPGMVGGAPEPERPAERPGTATFAIFAVLAFAAFSAWGVWSSVRTLMNLSEVYGASVFETLVAYEMTWLRVGVPMLIAVALLAFAVCSAPGLAKGRSGARLFTLVWSIIAAVATIAQLVFALISYMEFRELYGQMLSGPVAAPDDIASANTAFMIGFALGGLGALLSIVIFALMLNKGVKAWCPPRPAAIIMAVPGMQPQMQQQAPAGYGPPQQAPGQYPPAGPPPQPVPGQYPPQ